MMQGAARVRVTLALGTVVLTLIAAGCGGQGEPPPGPDVRGMALPDAKKNLDDAGVAYSVKADDSLFGVLVEDNWQVCSVERVNDQYVTLHVKKHGC